MYILNFHGLGDPPGSISEAERDCWLSPAFFSELLDTFAEGQRVAITFDDGNLSDYTRALPALVARRTIGTFFVVAGRVDQPGYLSRTQILEMLAAGMRVGSHGMHHRPWSLLDAGDLDEELVGARHFLEDIIGRAVQLAACPFGSYNRRVLKALKRCAYAKVYTSDGGPCDPKDWLQNRITVRAHQTTAAVRRRLTGAELPKMYMHKLKTLVKSMR